jgi:hypothetical protein
MCDPITATAAAVSIGSAAYQHQAQAKSAKNQKAALKEQGETISRNTGIRKVEETNAAAREIVGLNRDTSEVEGLIQTAAGEAGVQGQSLRLLLGDLAGERGRATQAVRDNLRSTRGQLSREGAASRRGVQTQLNQVQGPSLVATGLRIGGSLVDVSSIRESRKVTS